MGAAGDVEGSEPVTGRHRSTKYMVKINFKIVEAGQHEQKSTGMDEHQWKMIDIDDHNLKQYEHCKKIMKINGHSSRNDLAN